MATLRSPEQTDALQRLRRRLKRALLGAVILGALGGALLLTLLHRPLTLPTAPDSTRFLDRNGELLSAQPVPEQALGDWQPSFEDPIVLAVLAAEDHRFYEHGGIDAVAIVRAGRANWEAGKAVQGGSTITQQLARRLWDRPPGLKGKLWEAWTALRLEANLDKDEILVQYLNRIYFGNHSYGLDAAARTYLDKSPAALSIAEAALLAALPRSPEALDPWQHPTKAREARNRIIDRMEELGFIQALDAQSAREQVLGLRPGSAWSHAPHLVRRIGSEPGDIQTTIDLRIQIELQQIITEELAALERHNVDHAAVVVVDNQSAEVLAYAGSADWSAEDGQVDGAMARRSPGSALKPFAYWLGLERGLDRNGITLSTVLEDLPGSWQGSHGTWSPSNYDEVFHGPIQAREALARSLNLPAVRVTERVGTPVLQHRLEELGMSTLEERPDHYGLGLVLGNAEVRLDELTAAYLALARHGLYRPLKWRPEEEAEPRQVGMPTSAWLILDALDDADARAGSFMRSSDLEPSYPMAAKTGTSVGFRDNWALGITAEHTIGVWVGNFDGEPMNNLSGVMGAGPILRRLADFLHEGNEPLLAAAEETESARVCVLSGMRQGPDCPGGRVEHYLGGTTPGETCTWHRRIEVDMTGALATGCPGAMERMAIAWPGAFAEWARARREVGWPDQDHSCEASESDLPAPESGPPGITWPADGSVFYLDPRDPPEHQALSLRASLPHGSTGVRWWVDDQLLAEVQAPYTLRWVPTLGEHRLRLEREGQTIDEIRVWIGGE